MKKILCLIDTLGIGGAERQMMGLVSLLKQRGYPVDLVTYYKDNYHDELLKLHGINSTVLQVGDTSLSKIKAVRKYIKQNGYDWVITYKGGPNGIGCLLKMTGANFKLIVSERITTQRLKKRNSINFLLYSFAEFVVPNAHSQEEFLSAHFPWLKKKIVTITNFTDTDTFKPAAIQPHPEIRILTTARVARQKNVLRYLDAIALFKEKAKGLNVHFDWYGEVQSTELDYGEAVRNKVKDLQLEDIITFHDGTTQIVEKYQQCDIYCLPSNFEGYPNVVCEAMSCGKPVVASRVCDIPYIVKENENGLMFDPSDINDLADKLLKMVLMSKEQREAWGRKGREIAEKLFSREAFVDKYIRLIER